MWALRRRSTGNLPTSLPLRVAVEPLPFQLSAKTATRIRKNPALEILRPLFIYYFILFQTNKEQLTQPHLIIFEIDILSKKFRSLTNPCGFVRKSPDLHTRASRCVRRRASQVLELNVNMANNHQNFAKQNPRKKYHKNQLRKPKTDLKKKKKHPKSSQKKKTD